MNGFANSTRGLRIKDSDFEYLTEGAYGVIFCDRHFSRVRKIFKRRSEF